MRVVNWIAAALLAALPLQGNAAGFGKAEAVPSRNVDIIPGVTITATILKRSGEVATKVSSLSVLHLRSYVTVQKGTGSQTLNLHCRATWIDANGQPGDFVKDVPVCFKATAPATSLPYDLQLDVKFRPSQDDPPGTSGFRIEVWDEVTGARTEFDVTYGWKGFKS